MNKEVIDIAAQEIRRQHRDADFKLVLMENHEDTIQMRDGQVEKVQHATAQSLAMNLLIDGRDGFFYTNNLTPESLSSFIQQATSTTLLLQPDDARTLADPARYYKGGGIDLNNFDHRLTEIEPKRKIQLVQSNQEEILGTDKRIISAQTRYSDRQHKAHYLISNGFEGYEQCSHATISTILTVQGEGDQHPMDGWGETRIRFAELPNEGIAKTALHRTLRKIGSKPIKSGQYTMIVESPVAGNLLQPLLSALSGQALQQRTSFLADKAEKMVGSSLLHLVDDPLIPNTRGACHFDFDGVATQRREIFCNGRLHTFFIDTPYSHKLGLPPTTQGIHHLIMQPGNEPLEKLMQQAGNAILVTDFNGGNCDPATGNFSYGIEGFLVQGGVITQPVSGMNITGNMLTLWKALVAVSNDADPWETELIPSLVFADIQFGGA